MQKGSNIVVTTVFQREENLWGFLQSRPRSPRPPGFSHPSSRERPPLGTVRSFFLARGGVGGTRHARTWGASATRGAGVNQSPERRGAAARARAGGGRRAAAGSGAGGERGGPEEIGRGRERKAETEERESAEGLVQARPLRGDQEAGAALDNQHAEMVRSFHPPFLFIPDFVRNDSGARAPPGPPGAVFSSRPGA